MEHHPGTSAAADYRAELTIEGDAAERCVLSMNRIVRTHGTRLLLGRFDADAKCITLLVYALPAHGKMFVFNRRFLAMAEYSSKFELCSFGLTKTFLPTGNPRSLHLYFLFAFLVLLMTYVGTNTLLPGLHSYA